LLTKLTTKNEWGNKDRIESIEELSDRVFNVIIGTNVAYVVEAILSLLNKMIYLIIKKNHGSHFIKKRKSHAIIVYISNYKPAKSNNP
jgi:uncharacterized protein YlzI (FlbEa/FlbD family)